MLVQKMNDKCKRAWYTGITNLPPLLQTARKGPRNPRPKGRKRKEISAMNKSFYFNGLRLWVQGLLLLFLRWSQMKTGFDPATGLSRQSVPGTVLAVAILVLAAAEAVFAFRAPGGKRTYSNCLAPFSQGHLPLLAAGSLLLAAGSVLLPGWGPLEITAAAGGICTAAGLILFARIVRSGGDVKVFQLLPAMIFSVVFLLEIYLPEEGNPVLARYYLPVLSAALIACFFYQLAGLVLREGKLRWLVFFGNLSVPLALASMADCAGNLGRTLVYFGFALVTTIFLLLRRDEVLPEPEAEEDGEENSEN